MMKTSWPRTFSLIFTNDSPSGKLVTVASPSGSPIDLQMASARGRLELPVKIFSRVSLMCPRILRATLLGGRLFCVNELIFNCRDPFEEVRQSLFQHGNSPLQHKRNCRCAVHENT